MDLHIELKPGDFFDRAGKNQRGISIRYVRSKSKPLSSELVCIIMGSVPTPTGRAATECVPPLPPPRMTYVMATP